MHEICMQENRFRGLICSTGVGMWTKSRLFSLGSFARLIIRNPTTVKKFHNSQIYSSTLNIRPNKFFNFFRNVDYISARISKIKIRISREAIFFPCETRPINLSLPREEASHRNSIDAVLNFIFVASPQVIKPGWRHSVWVYGGRRLFVRFEPRPSPTLSSSAYVHRPYRRSSFAHNSHCIPMLSTRDILYDYIKLGWAT